MGLATPNNGMAARPADGLQGLLAKHGHLISREKIGSIEYQEYHPAEGTGEKGQNADMTGWPGPASGTGLDGDVGKPGLMRRNVHRRSSVRRWPAAWGIDGVLPQLAQRLGR